MATTSRPITELTSGIRDTAGAVVASGKARFYQPGTLVAQTVFSDAACSSAISMPYTLSAVGQGTVYTLEAVRMIVKDSTESTTYFDDIVNLNRHDAVYVTSPGINGGAETTLETVLSTATTSLGAGFQYKVTSAGTVRNYVTVLSERRVSVKDFGAAGDGITNDYAACQATIDYVAGLTVPGGRVFFPAGTYLCNTGLSNTTVGVCFEGEGRALSLIKNGSTSNTLLTYNVGSAIDSKGFIRDLGFSASSTSSGTAVLVSNGDRIEISNVSTALHRTGIDTTLVTAARVEHCIVLSTDDNAAAIGIRLGARGKATDCEAISGTTNGTGYSLAGAKSKAADCYAEKFATGFSCTGSASRTVGCSAASSTTGFSLAATATTADCADAASCTTGVSVAAVASPRLLGVTYSGNTTDLVLASSSTNVLEMSNYATSTDSGSTPYVIPVRATSTRVASNADPIPFIHSPGVYQTISSTTSTGRAIGAPSGSVKVIGDVLQLRFYTTSGANTALTWNAVYVDPTGAAMTGFTLDTFANAGSLQLTVVWNGTSYVVVRMIITNSSVCVF